MPRPLEILHLALLPTPHGEFLAHFSAEGLAQLDFPTKRARGDAQPADELPVPFRAVSPNVGAMSRRLSKKR